MKRRGVFCGILNTVLFILLIFPATAFSQDVNGKWYGVATVENMPGNNFMVELILKRSGSSKVTGYLNYYFRDGYFTNEIEGNYNLKTRELAIKAVPILHVRTVNVATGVDCFMQGVFTLFASRVSTQLSGQFYSQAQAYTCPPLNIKFEKLLKEPPPEPEVPEQLEMQVKAEPVEPKAMVETKTEMAKRATTVTRILDVVDDSVDIAIYDNAEFDNDSISVFYNGKLELHKKQLHTRAPIRMKVFVDNNELNNDLVLFAENLGAMPPNAGLMVITDSKSRHEVHVISTMDRNSGVRLRKKVQSNSLPARYTSTTKSETGATN